MTDSPQVCSSFAKEGESEPESINFHESLRFFQEQLSIHGSSFHVPGNDSGNYCSLPSKYSGNLSEHQSVDFRLEEGVKPSRISIPTVETILESVRVLRAIQKSQKDKWPTQRCSGCEQIENDPDFDSCPVVDELPKNGTDICIRQDRELNNIINNYLHNKSSSTQGENVLISTEINEKESSHHGYGNHGNSPQFWPSSIVDKPHKNGKIFCGESCHAEISNIIENKENVVRVDHEKETSIFGEQLEKDSSLREKTLVCQENCDGVRVDIESEEQYVDVGDCDIMLGSNTQYSTNEIYSVKYCPNESSVDLSLSKDCFEAADVYPCMKENDYKSFIGEYLTGGENTQLQTTRENENNVEEKKIESETETQEDAFLANSFDSQTDSYRILNDSVSSILELNGTIPSVELFRETSAEELQVNKNLFDDELKVLKNLSAEELKVVKNISAEELKIEKNLSADDLKVVKNITAEELKVIKNITTEEVKVVKKHSAVELEAVKNIIAEELKVVKNNCAEELKFVENITAEELKVAQSLSAGETDSEEKFKKSVESSAVMVNCKDDQECSSGTTIVLSDTFSPTNLESTGGNAAEGMPLESESKLFTSEVTLGHRDKETLESITTKRFLTSSWDLVSIIKLLYKLTDLQISQPQNVEKEEKQSWEPDCIPLVYYPLKFHQNVIVVDLGSCSVRAGILMDQPTLPSLFFPSVCATHRITGEHVYGMEALRSDVRQNSIISFPLRPSVKIIKHSIDVEKVAGIFQKIFQELRVDASEYKVQVCLPRSLSVGAQNDLVEVLLEGFHVQAVCLAHQAIFTMYAYDATTGIVVDIGDRMDILLIIDGFVVESGVTRLPHGGQRLVHHMKHALAQKQISLSNDIDSFVVQYIAENTCFIASNYEEEKRLAVMHPELVKKSVDLQIFAKDDNCLQCATLDDARFSVPEGLFDPDLWGLDSPGVHKLVQKAIQAAGVDARKQVAQNIFVSGGVTLTPGFVERLREEVGRLNKPRITPKVHASNFRYHCTFIGACKFSRMDAFHRVCVTREEFNKNRTAALKKFVLCI